MSASQGGPAPEYEDRLRALGWFLDRERLCRFNLTVECEDCFLLVHSQQRPDEEPRQLRFTASEIESLRASALQRRGTGAMRAMFRPSRLSALRERRASGVPLSTWLEETRALPYQEVLRLIGRELDICKARAFRIDEQQSGLLVRIRITSSGPDIYQVYLLPRDELRTRAANAIEQRKVQSAAM